jgi:NADH-quinone oxidoreductase subunit M
MTHLVTVILFLPLLGALACLAVDKEEEGALRFIGLATSLLTFGLSLLLLKGFDPSQGGAQLQDSVSWVPALGINYHVGIDGISLFLVLLTTLLVPLTFLSATKAITRKTREFVVCLLLLETGMIGAFVALDLFLFYVFWELMLVPMYFLIGIWGGDKRLRASIKFVIFTMVGSLLMLVAIFYLYVAHHTATGTYTMDYEALRQTVLPHDAQIWCFLAFALAFGIKVPMFPFHTWLPDAHTEAPTSGSVILAGVLLKFGPFGFLRFAVPLFPWAAWKLSPLFAGLGVAGILYGAIVAYAQDDAKKFIAYTSISHLGFCILGVFAWNPRAIQGAVFTMLSHGLTTGALFLCFGMLYERRHTRKIDEFGGLWARMPVFAGLFLVATMGSLGLPALSGFVGEFLTLLGAFGANDPTSMPAHPADLVQPLYHAKIVTAIATTGVILSAVYMLYLFQKLMLGPLSNPRNEKLDDASPREVVVLAPLAGLILLFGLYPAPVLSRMDATVQKYLSDFGQKVMVADSLEPRMLNPDQGAATDEAAPAPSAPAPTAAPLPQAPTAPANRPLPTPVPGQVLPPNPLRVNPILPNPAANPAMDHRFVAPPAPAPAPGGAP